jgi:hypothetical protein
MKLIFKLMLVSWSKLTHFPNTLDRSASVSILKLI